MINVVDNICIIQLLDLMRGDDKFLTLHLPEAIGRWME